MCKHLFLEHRTMLPEIGLTFTWIRRIHSGKNIDFRSKSAENRKLRFCDVADKWFWRQSGAFIEVSSRFCKYVTSPKLALISFEQRGISVLKMKRTWEYIQPKILIVLIYDHLAYDRQSYAMSTCQEGGVEMVDRHPVPTLVGASECSECSDKHIQSYLIL